MNLGFWEEKFEELVSLSCPPDDPAHDLLHFRRVVSTAKKICVAENGNLNVVVPAAWLHDLVVVPKDSPLRSQASTMSAKKAFAFLTENNFEEILIPQICHAIEAHSFSAQIEPQTIEAKIVQDADRLDGLGAIGVARCFATSGLLKRPFYSQNDPFCETRKPDDSVFTVDHFYKKLFLTAETLKTRTGEELGHKRVLAMKNFLKDLAQEII